MRWGLHAVVGVCGAAGVTQPLQCPLESYGQLLPIPEPWHDVLWLGAPLWKQSATFPPPGFRCRGGSHSGIPCNDSMCYEACLPQEPNTPGPDGGQELAAQGFGSATTSLCRLS